jgi:hypothetical protein
VPNEFAGIPEPRSNTGALFSTVSALKQNVEVLLGLRGSGQSAAALTVDVESLQAQITALAARVTKLGG